jgi:hypothetical protein
MKLTTLFIISGLLQMILARYFNLHEGLEHMIFTHWWQYAIESFFYSLCHAGLYFYFKNN